MLCTHFPSCYFNQQQLREYFFRKKYKIYSSIHDSHLSLTPHTKKRSLCTFCRLILQHSSVPVLWREKNTKNKYKNRKKNKNVSPFLLSERRRMREKRWQAVAVAIIHAFFCIAFRSSSSASLCARWCTPIPSTQVLSMLHEPYEKTICFIISK